MQTRPTILNIVGSCRAVLVAVFNAMQQNDSRDNTMDSGIKMYPQTYFSCLSAISLNGMQRGCTNKTTKNSESEAIDDSSNEKLFSSGSGFFMHGQIIPHKLLKSLPFVMNFT